MKKALKQPLFLFCLLLTGAGKTLAQQAIATDTLLPGPASSALQVTRLAGDSLVSSFVIFIRNEVKPHRHLTHSEHVYVLAGKGSMRLGDREFDIRPGMLVFIPSGTVHSVKTTSAEPLKVLSLQAPEFDGKDREWVE